MANDLLKIGFKIKREPFISTSHTTYTNLTQSFLRGVLTKQKEDPLLSYGIQRYWGDLVHNLIEDSSKGKFQDQNDIKEEFDLRIKEISEDIDKNRLEKVFLPFEKHIRDFGVKKKSAIQKAKSCFVINKPKEQKNTISSKIKMPIGREIEVSSKDNLVRGKIDEVKKQDEGVHLFDLKTGEIKEKESSEIKKSIRDQLYLYAFLYKQEHNIWPNKLFVEDSRGKKHQIELHKEDAKLHFEEVKNQLEEINDLLASDLNDEELTTILCKKNNQEECKCEEFRPKCPVHFNNLKNKDNFRDTDYLDIIGHLGKIEIYNDHAELEILPIKEQDTLIVKKMSLSKLPSMELLKEGVLIGLFNMYLNNFNGFFVELQNSRGYIYSDE